MHSRHKAIWMAALTLNAAVAFNMQGQEKLLYSFGATTKDGHTPVGGLVLDSHGHLYGTASAGGAHGHGAVFELSRGDDGLWSEKTLYSFGVTAVDGWEPLGNLIFDQEGNLYGTTFAGGANGDGTVFELKRAAGGWTESILHSFTYSVDHKDGSAPMGGLVFGKEGNLFGTTSLGGPKFNDLDLPGNSGTVFKLSPTSSGKWTEKVLHTFSATSDPFPVKYDGANPQGSLVVDANGNLFGTTAFGGAAPNAFVPVGGIGTVFELSPTSDGYIESALYGFASGDPDLIPYEGVDGAFPSPNLVMDEHGNLFGTTSSMFSFETFSLTQNGSIFAIPGENLGAEGPYLQFGGYAGDAQYPQAGLVFDSKGNLFGTSTYGGAFGGYYGTDPTGTVFEASAKKGVWSDKVLYSFGSIANDGALPMGSLVIDEAGNLYGITSKGGVFGKGTVFEIPAAPLPAPRFSPPPAIYAKPQQVEITDVAPGTVIYYTIDGSKPTTASARFTEPIEVSKSTKLKAIAVGPYEWQSAVKTAAYLIGPRAATPVFSVKSGTYGAVQTVTITDTTARATIFYTINGDTPTTSSAKYKLPIHVAKSETVKAIAAAAGDFDSAVATAKYTIKNQQ